MPAPPLSSAVLYGTDGQQLSPDVLTFSLSSVWQSFRGSNCNDGDAGTICHTLGLDGSTTPGTWDAHPTLTITYPCNGSTDLTRVVVTNTPDSCCKDRILDYRISFLNSTGHKDQKTFYFSAVSDTYTAQLAGGALGLGVPFPCFLGLSEMRICLLPANYKARMHSDRYCASFSPTTMALCHARCRYDVQHHHHKPCTVRIHEVAA